jgi:hypothetical protein
MQRTGAVTAGYVILGLLGLADALSFALGSGSDGPPFIINLIGTVLGLLTLWALVTIVRSRRTGAPPARQMILLIVVTRALSALLSIPAYFADIAGGIKVLVTITIVLTIVGLVLVRPDVAAADNRS